MARVRKAEEFGLCPSCSRWYAVKLDGTLQTHGPYSRRRNDPAAGHHNRIPVRLMSREEYLRIQSELLTL